MVCRENPASSIAIGLARTGTWMDDAQVQSIVHRLRHEFNGHAPPPSYRRDEFVAAALDRSERSIDANPNLGRERRQGLRNRLARAREQTGGLRDDILWAMSRLEDGVQTSQAALDGRLGEIAGRRGMSLREARAEFIQLRAEAPAGRQPRANAAELRDLGVIPSDPATRHALSTMSEREPLLPPVRLVQRWVSVSGPEAGGSSVRRIGISHLSNRVELLRADGSTVAYRVPADTIAHVEQSFEQGAPDQQTVALLEAAGGRIPRVEETAYALRCDECGQFVGENWHDCPGRGRVALVAQEEFTVGAARLSAPDPAHLSDLVEQNGGRPIEAPVRWRSGDADVTGTVLVRPGLQAVRGLDRTTRQRLDVDDAGAGAASAGPVGEDQQPADQLYCRTCSSAQCRHIAQAREGVRDLLGRAGGLPQEEVSEALLALGVTTRPREEPQAGGTEPASTQPAVSFLAEPEAFRHAVLASDRVVPFLPDGGLEGLAGGTRFGVELEFEASNRSDTEVVTRRLARDGLITNSLGSYHTAARTGYPRWILESDGSLSYGAELVSPILSDNAEHWAQLRTACDSIRDNGGITDHAGSHVNISSDDYTPQYAWRLANLMRAHEDDIYRMGRTRGSQRSQGYNSPFPDPGPAWGSPWEVTRRQAGRERALNFAAAFEQGGRIEFRFPDASHDAGVVQAQVNLCAAMANHVRTHDVEPDLHQPLHSARHGGWARNLMVQGADEFSDRTRGVRSLIDTLFRTDAGRQQIASLWGRGSYYR